MYLKNYIESSHPLEPVQPAPNIYPEGVSQDKWVHDHDGVRLIRLN